MIKADCTTYEPEGMFHALLCDPPYHLHNSMVKPLPDLQEYDNGKGNPYARQQARTGFMGKKWDGGDVAFRPETWAHFKKFLYPGAFGMAFASSRGFHRMAVAIEDAGFIIHPMIGWLYGSGFPKATRIDTQIDKFGGLPIPREEIAQAIKNARIKRGLTAGECDKHFCNGTSNWSWFEGRPKGINIPNGEMFSEIARKWPELQKYADAVLEAERKIVGKDGRGEIKDTIFFGDANKAKESGKAIGYGNWDLTEPSTDLAKQWEGHRYGLQAQKPALEPICVFQKPYEGKPVDCIVKTGAGALNIDGGRIKSGDKLARPMNDANNEIYGKYTEFGNPIEPTGRWPANFVLSEDMRYVIDEQSGDCKTGGSDGSRKKGPYSDNRTWSVSKTPGKNTINGIPPSEGGASRYFFRYPVIYQAKANKKERNAGLDKNCIHPTVKPIKLIEHLATLLLPPSGYHRRIYVPFAGVASEMIGCILAGWDEVVGCEMEQEYIDIGEARIKYWTDEMKRQPRLI